MAVLDLIGRLKARKTLASIAAQIPGSNDLTAKPHYIWETYEPYLSPLADKPITLLELGVNRGSSMVTFSRYFRAGRIIGIHNAPPKLSFSAIRGVKVVQADQRDEKKLNEICDENAPEGFDVIIDDASHAGVARLDSYRILFPRVKPGGLYVIEDWQTGYIPTWGDGAEMRAPELLDERHGIPTRIASHDFGMVGFVKFLVDELAKDETTFSWLHYHRSMVVIKKPEARAA